MSFNELALAVSTAANILENKKGSSEK
jgi:hypothetical protein